MIDIKISENYTEEDGTVKKISDVKKFINGFKQLCNETNMHTVDVGGFKSCPVITTLKFDDGSSIGISKLFDMIGFNMQQLIG